MATAASTSTMPSWCGCFCCGEVELRGMTERNGGKCMISSFNGELLCVEVIDDGASGGGGWFANRA